LPSPRSIRSDSGPAKKGRKDGHREQGMKGEKKERSHDVDVFFFARAAVLEKRLPRFI
jgi:hypothetical protein